MTGSKLDSLTRAICTTRPAPYALRLRFGSCRLRLRSNETALVDRLRGYFHGFLDDEGPPADLDFTAIEMAEPDLGLDFEDWPRDPGKTGRKDAVAELAGGRVVHKVRTGMQFLVSPDRRIAFGPCLANTNQVINFLISQYLGWLADRDWQICHAAGVVVAGCGIGISAFSGGGKSTLALHLMSAGATFVSNDRLLIRNARGARMAGVPKQPRINPGTILNNPDLAGIIPDARRLKLASLPADALWNLEEKYDADIERCFGKGRVSLEAPLNAFVVLSWKRGGATPFALHRVDPGARPGLLDAVMKPPGAFYQPRSGVAPRSFAELDRGAYLACLKDVPVFEATGRVDFDAAVEAVMDEVISTLAQAGR